MTDAPPLDAGRFAPWLEEIRAAMRDERASEVPCGTCTACCSSSQFVHIGPDEHDALQHIPQELLFPAPRMPRGHVLMGYDEHGRCPMLVDERCTIYAHRPRTCRTYDCRIFPASGTGPEDDSKALIATQAARWRFTHATADDAALHQAVRAAAAYLLDHADDLPTGSTPTTATQRAVLAIHIHDAFVDDPAPSPRAVEVALTRRP